MSTRGKILSGVIVLFFICLVVWVVRTTPDAPPPIDRLEAPATMSYGGNTLTEERDGVKIWDLTAESMEVEIQSQNVMMKNLVGHFYSKDGNTIELHAQNGMYNQVTKDIHVDTEVVVTTTDGAKLTGDSLDWIAAEEILVAQGKARVTKEDMLAEGDRIEAREGMQKIKIQGHAHIVKGVKQDEQKK